MILTKCDGPCETISPDSSGMHIANTWVKVTVEYPVSRPNTLVFCEYCWARGMAALYSDRADGSTRPSGSNQASTSAAQDV